jgi:hypothetical protein
MTAATGGEIIIWDVGTGKIVERYQTNQTGLEAAFFDQNNSDIIFESYDEYKKIHRTILSNAHWGSGYNAFIDSADQAFSLTRQEMNMSEKKKSEALATQNGMDVSKPFGRSQSFLVGFSGEHLRTSTCVQLICNQNSSATCLCQIARCFSQPRSTFTGIMLSFLKAKGTPLCL